MAQVAQGAQLRVWIDDYLAYLLATWRGLPAVAAEWDAWDEPARLTFVVDWAVPADRLHQLEQWVAEGCLTPEQRRRYDELRQLVVAHQPLLERLLAD